jgi:hypothetical protein
MDYLAISLIRLQEELLASTGSDGKMKAEILFFERLAREASADQPTLFFQAMPRGAGRLNVMNIARALRDPSGLGFMYFYNEGPTRSSARGVVMASNGDARQGWELELHHDGYMSLTDFSFRTAPADKLERIEILGRLYNEILSGDLRDSGYVLRCRIFNARQLNARYPLEMPMPELLTRPDTPFNRATDHLANLIRAELGLPFTSSSYP